MNRSSVRFRQAAPGSEGMADQDQTRRDTSYNANEGCPASRRTRPRPSAGHRPVVTGAGMIWNARIAIDGSARSRRRVEIQYAGSRWARWVAGRLGRAWSSGCGCRVRLRSRTAWPASRALSWSAVRRQLCHECQPGGSYVGRSRVSGVGRASGVDGFGQLVAEGQRDLLDRHAAAWRQATTRSCPGSRAGSFDHGLMIRFLAAGRPDDGVLGTRNEQVVGSIPTGGSQVRGLTSKGSVQVWLEVLSLVPGRPQGRVNELTKITRITHLEMNDFTFGKTEGQWVDPTPRFRNIGAGTLDIENHQAAVGDGGYHPMWSPTCWPTRWT